MPSNRPPSARVLSRRREIGEQIRAVRKEERLTQLEVVRRADMDLATYNRIEQGHSSPLLDTLIRIADAIGRPLADLVREPPSADGSRTGPGPASPRRET